MNTNYDNEYKIFDYQMHHKPQTRYVHNKE